MRQRKLVSEIIHEGCKWATIEFGRLITVKDMVGPSKCRAYTDPRWFCIAYMHAIGTKSLPQVGNAFNRDHTTILYGLRRAHGPDGKWFKGRPQPEPLWTKEHFINLVVRDGLRESPVVSADAPHIERVGLENLNRFVSGKGWAA